MADIDVDPMLTTTEIALAATQVAKRHADNNVDSRNGSGPVLSRDQKESEIPVRFVTRKRVAAAVAALAIGGGGVAAYAYFTGGSGSGSGSAQTGSTTSWAVGALTFSGGPMYPGLGTETATYTVTNTGGGNQALTGVTASVNASNGNITQGGVELTGCTASWYQATAGAPTPAVGSVIAKNGTATGTVSVVLNESNTNQNVCKGATPDVTVTAS